MTPARIMTPRGYWRDVPTWERRDMTVCIAASCEEGSDDPKVVVCADTRISGALGSADIMLKLRHLTDSWRCLTAGTDTDILATVELLKQSFRPVGTIDETNVLQLTKAALNQRKRDKANECTQGKFGISYDDFLKYGKTQLPDDLFRNTAMEIDLISIEAEFIIVGFPTVGGVLMVKTDRRCGAVLKEDFVTIGEGGYLAQASLLNRGHHYMMSLERTLYNVYEAKRFAEGAPTVGPVTALSVFRKSGLYEHATEKGLDFLKSNYQQVSRRDIPDLKLPDDCFYEVGKK